MDPPLPTVSLSSDSTSIREGSTATVTLTLSEVLTSDATFNLISGGNATYGTSADWNLSVGGTDCGMATESNPCQITISEGNTTAEVTVEANSAVSPPEIAIVSVEVDSGSLTIVEPGSRSSLNFTIRLPSVSLNYSGNGTIDIGSSISRMTINLEEANTQDVTLDIAGVGSGTATYQNFATPFNTWGIRYNNIQAEMMPPSDFLLAGTACGDMSPGCEITISAGQTIVDLAIFTHNLTRGQTITVTLGVNPASSSLVGLGSPSTHTLTVP